MIYACAGGELSLPWTASVNSPRTIEQVTWFHQSTTRDVIAMATNGRFIPMPESAGRVHQTTNCGILLDSLTMSDAGNYSVDVTVRNAGVIHVWRTSVDVIVTGTVCHRLELSVEIIRRSPFLVLLLSHWFWVTGFRSLVLGHLLWITGFGSLVLGYWLWVTACVSSRHCFFCLD